MNKTKLLLLVTLLVLTGVFSVGADEEDTDAPHAYPTALALANTHIPPKDTVDLARRLRGLESMPAGRDTPATRDIGMREAFWVTNTTSGESFQVDARLRAIGEHSYIWVQEGGEISAETAATIADTFDTEVYEPVRALWGQEASPGVDGDPRLHILFAGNMGAFTGAYFSQRHTFPEAVVGQSNEREMFFVNLDAYGSGASVDGLRSVLAHEFQHMIRFNLDANEATWLNEGFSTFTELYIGSSSPYRYPGYFLPLPGTQLNTFGLADTARAQYYGAAFLFVTYFHQRYGEEGLRRLSQQDANGLMAVDATLQALDAPGVNKLFADWVLANYIQDGDVAGGRYGYPASLPLQAPPTRTTQNTPPYTWSSEASQYSTGYYRVDDLTNVDTLRVTLDAPETTQLVPTQAASGKYFWYSNRGDSSNTRLTRRFDLRDVESATLEYKTWYAIEENWDYAYLTVSADGGDTWEIINTPRTTTADPYGNNYGTGYTGYTDGWVSESISLDAYAGQDILVRFEYVTDDAVTEDGIAIDDVRVPELGYNTSFENDAGGWQADGWLRIDNVLPQNLWVQVIEYGGDSVLTTTRWMAPEEADRLLNLSDGTTHTVIAVSPFAPVTTVPTDYTLRVEPMTQ